MKEECEATLTFLGMYKFVASKVEVFNDDTEQYKTFDLIDKDHMPPSGSDYSDLTDAQVNDMKYWIYIKHKFNISDEACHKMARKSEFIPNTY